MNEPAVSAEEKREAHRRERPRSAVIFETIRAEGDSELERDSGSLFFSALAAGLSMAFSMLGVGVLHAGLPDTPWRPLVAAGGYTLGFLIVILGRQQLFTENTITPLLPLMHRPTVWKVRAVGRLWAVILVGNVLGAAIAALLIARGGAFAPNLLHSFDEIAATTLSFPLAMSFVKAVFAGWLIALMVWLLPLAETATPFIIIVLTGMVAAGQFQHIVAGSVEALYAVFRGSASWLDFLRFFVPTLLGNIVGGAALVGAVAGAEMAAERHARRKSARR